MSEERRISLAELLAREGAPAPSSTGGRRRRHRGGENSITVAELTGEIPVVRDDQPAPADVQAAQEAPEVPEVAPEVPEVRAAEVEDVQAPEVQAPEVQDVEAVDVAVEDATEAGEGEPITSSFLAAAVADAAEAPAGTGDEEPAAEAAGTAETGDAAPATETRRERPLRWRRTKAAPATPEAPEPQADAARADAAQADAAPEAAQADAALAAAAPEPGERTDFAWSRWDQAEAPIMATADFNTAQVRERQSRFAETHEDDTVDVAPAVPAQDDAAPDTASLSAAQIDAVRAGGNGGLLEKDSDDDLDRDLDREVRDGFDHDRDDRVGAVDRAKSGAGRSWLVLAAEVVLGLAAGAGLFYGFFRLWNWGGGKATIALTVVLAFIVIIGIVTFTHYLRKTTDYLTLALALLVGLVITFGPLLMALGTD